MPFTRVVLKPHVTWSDFRMHGRHPSKWGRAVLVTPLKSDEPYLNRWKSTDGSYTITYIQDPVREIRFYHVMGTDSDSHAELIRSHLATFSRAEVEGFMAADGQTVAEKMTAIYLAAATALAELDPTILDYLIRSLADADPAVRRATIDAALVALWPDLGPPLERVATSDADADLCAFAGKTLETLRSRVWDAAPGVFDFEPIPPDPRRVTPPTGIGDDWYEAAHGNRPARKSAAAPAPSRKPEFHPPDWLAEMMKAGDRDGVRWHAADQVRAAGVLPEFRKPDRMALSDAALARNRARWEAMVPVADGPEFTDRVGRTERSRLFVNRDAPQTLLLVLAADHPPALWVPAGRTPEGVAAAVAAYLFPGVPPQADLPFQGRLFLSTQVMIGGFEEVERGVTASPFTDMLPWGSSHPADPYQDRVPLGQVPVGELRRYMAQAPDGLPRTSLRTRYSRAVVQLLDWRNGYFADLYFRPAPPADWAAGYNTECGTDFPPGTPVDVAGALSGLACLGPERIRPQMEAADDDDQRRGMQEIIEFLEHLPAVP